tara:strand:- start:1584 stop:1916 length:333 start_codon:yes stop_codon:yes gene_type:complete
MLSLNDINAQRNLNSIDKVSLMELMKSDKIQLLDVRTENEFKLGSIEGAINVDYWDPDFVDKVLFLFDKKITTIVYCAAGGRSEMAAKLLLTKGFKKLYNFKGGYESYIN